MPRVLSQMVELGTPAPSFTLPDSNGTMHSLDDAAEAKAILVVFMCNHCPFVKHLADELAAMTTKYSAEGLKTFGIMSNDIESHPEDGPEKMAAEVTSRGYTFPYLFDADQEVAKAYKAMCTPDFFLYGPDRILAYRGQFDDSRPDNGSATGDDLDAAIEAILFGDPVPAEQMPSLGCNIKWRPGNEPDYVSE